ncbi:hypothetical protein BO70DRAFT_158779 [Aspergillus heteromorphus CBS 117.55]|uniref:Uncharacterized protein n=1 Tax=Aspergillus heteromorphus CBS 117.55 TaxID=1448321 RepID=A0A317WRJ1_9EURO|nr:uncharacterized protein BO70DRAFT_158779 [Aspergillus heteromorphus CBS 117.55]PWY89019.1 hypothetical protein BO70DRAFT_158779 [Aspergillus heteromorphus CBS 117.55]
MRSARLTLTGHPYFDAAQGWMTSGQVSMCSRSALRNTLVWQSGQVVLRLGHSSLTCSCRKELVSKSGLRLSRNGTYLVVLLHDVLVAAQAAMGLVQTPALRAEGLLPGLLAAGAVRAVDEPVAAVLVDVRLDMAPWDDFTAAFVAERAAHADFIAHVDQQTRHIEVDAPRGGATGGTCKVVSTRGERGDGGIQAFLAEHMVALETHRANEGAATYRTHEVVIVGGDGLQRAEVDNLVSVAGCLHREQFLEGDACHNPIPLPTRESSNLYCPSSDSSADRVNPVQGKERGQ